MVVGGIVNTTVRMRKGKGKGEGMILFTSIYSGSGYRAEELSQLTAALGSVAAGYRLAWFKRELFLYNSFTNLLDASCCMIGDSVFD